MEATDKARYERAAGHRRNGQGITFENGRADFRNRWIRTPKYVLEEQHGKGMFSWSDGCWDDWRTFGLGDVERDRFTFGVPQGTNNVNIFPFAGQMVATADSVGAPIAIDPLTLETVGIVPWSSKLSAGLHEKAAFGDAGFTAHPKWDHESGTLYGLTYRDTKPYVTMHYVRVDGSVDSRDVWDAPYNTVAHDIWLTPEHVVLPFQPFLVDKARINRVPASTLGSPTCRSLSVSSHAPTSMPISDG